MKKKEVMVLRIEELELESRHPDLYLVVRGWPEGAECFLDRGEPKALYEKYDHNLCTVILVPFQEVQRAFSLYLGGSNGKHQG
ncbi:MAG: hypothetical protein QXP27_00380 [Candidatus Methanomethyliaceae archaeon]